MGEVMVGIVSDTHGWLDPQVIEAFEGADLILHAGDIGDEAVLTELEKVAPVKAVRGNIDGGPLRFLPLEVCVDVGDRTVVMRHIAGSPRRPNRATRELLGRTDPDLIVVGHSHIPVVARVGDALWLNPGAAGFQGFHDMRFAARLRVDETGEMSLERVHLGPRVRPKGA